MAAWRVARKINWMASTASTDASESAEAAAAMEDQVASSEAGLGRIYRISAPGCDQVYVGSTRKTLSARLLSHQQGMRQWQRGGGVT